MQNIGDDMEKREPLHTVGENANLYSHYRNVYAKSELLYDPVMPCFLGVYLMEMKSAHQRSVYTLLFVAAPFTVAMILNQLSVRQLIDGKWKCAVHADGLLLNLKRQGNTVIATTCMDPGDRYYAQRKIPGMNRQIDIAGSQSYVDMKRLILQSSGIEWWLPKG